MGFRHYGGKIERYNLSINGKYTVFGFSIGVFGLILSLAAGSILLFLATLFVSLGILYVGQKKYEKQENPFRRERFEMHVADAERCLAEGRLTDMQEALRRASIYGDPPQSLNEALKEALKGNIPS